MLRRTFMTTAALITLGTGAFAAAHAAEKDIVDTAIDAGNFTTLVAAVEAAGLVETLKGEGPFTVFAPTDEAFAALPEGTVDGLLADPEALTKILTYHVVPGVYTAQDLMALAKKGGGQGTLTTVAGEPLAVEVQGKKVYVTDVKGNTATVTIPNVMQSNGVIHVVNTVLMP